MRRFVAAMAVAVMIGLGVGLWTWTRPGDTALLGAPGPQAAVHVLDNGFHTDLALPRAALEARSGPLGQAVRELDPGDWVLIGWGDATFYVEQGPIGGRLADGARAFFRPGNASVVMLAPWSGDPARIAPDARRSLTLSPAAFTAMSDRIEASLALDQGRARIAAARPGDDARFFSSAETFSVLHLCNHWTAEVLNAAGLPVGPVRSITSGGVMRAARAPARLDLAAAGD